MKDEMKADMLRALAHPTRLRIVQLLAPGEKCVCELLPLLQLEQPNVSQHLTILRQSGIVETEKRGTMIFYRLKNSKFATLLELFDQIILEEIEKNQEILRELRSVK